MTRKEIAQARSLVETLLKHTRKGTASHAVAVELEALLRPSPTIEEIVLSLDAENHKERAKLIGISRQGYYNILQGIARPNSITTKRLADLTGVSEEVIRQASP